MSNAYTAAVNRVIDYVQEDLQADTSLATLARVARISPYHFHRVFKAFTGETLGAFVRRVRLERAASLLLLAPERPVTEIALDVGFTSPAAFARAFKERFDLSASEWRAVYESKIGKAMSNLGNANPRLERYFEPGAGAPKWRLLMTESHLKVDVEVRELPKRVVAYLRHVGPYQGNSELFGRLFGQLAEWAGTRGLLGPDAQFLSLYHENPKVTESDKLSVMIACVVPPETEVQGEIAKTTVAGGTYGVGHFEIGADEYTAAWDAMYGTWLPESGYEPADGPAFEVYLNDPRTHPENKHIVEICVPIRRP